MDEQSAYKSQYKSSSVNSEIRQEQRRKLLLREQKIQRSKIQDAERFSFLEFVSQTKVEKKEKLSFKKKYNLHFSLQLSEWLREKPEDLNNWYLVPCPKGQRCFVIACNGITEAYNKNGKRLFYFHSKLPGDGSLKNEMTLIDCVYCNKSNTFFVLDAVLLGSHNLYFCEASFRYFWIRSRFIDSDNYNNCDKDSNFTFKPIEWFNFEDDESIKSCLMKYPIFENNVPELDGYLFYHKDASYTFGNTPLVGWLFPFMINEVLGYEVNEIYMLDKPKNYSDYLNFIHIFDEDLAKKKNRNRKCFDKMDEDVGEKDELEMLINDEALLELGD